MTANELELYITGTVKSPCYDETVKLYKKLKCHADGEYPRELINERRPSESNHIKEYREKIYVPITKETFQQVITSLSKIRRSSDWNIQYPVDEIAGIADEERLEEYCEEYFPYYESVSNWAFSELLKQYLIDSNAVILTLPINSVVQENEYLKPFPFIFNSDKVLEFKEGLAILQGEKVKKIMSDGTSFDSEVYYVVDSVQVERFEKLTPDSRYTSVSVFVHGLSKMPCFKVGGLMKEKKYNQPIFESRVNTLAPRLDEVVREYSDLQAEVVQHIHSEKWIWATQECDACGHDGIPKGYIKTTKGTSKCKKCDGHGTVSASPYQNIVIRPSNKNMGEQDMPTPPAGYIQKDVEIVKIQDERIEKHVYKALTSINMQFLVEVPLNQSGTAKEVDRDELNNFVYSIAEDLVRIMDKVYYFINEYRYMLVVPDANRREEMLPKIAVPEHFDLLSAQYMIEERKQAKEAGINPVLINAMDLELASKMFYTNPIVVDVVELVQELDPIPSKTEDEKMILLSNRGVTELDYIISSNIQPFVKRALRENPQFKDLDYDVKYKTIEGYAKEKQKQNSVRAEFETATDSEENSNGQRGEQQRTE